ncbi:MAG: threonylcarbamoyl-AMP synthase [bacterium]|nr:threonylcarbamoyl-AMP synthase [bacterium]
MKTEILNFSEQGSVQRAAELLRKGGIVAFPTETVYGLGCDFLNEDAVRRIFEAKERSFSKPLALHAADFASVQQYMKNLPEDIKALASKYLPGPLMIIAEKTDKVPDFVTGGIKKVGVRIPSCDAFSALAKAFGKPIAATSANKSGAPAPSCSSQVIAALDGMIDAVLVDDSGTAGVASTILDVSSRPLRVLRTGFLKASDIAESIGEGVLLSDDGSVVRTDESSSRVKVILVEGERPKALKKIKALYEKLSANEPDSVGILLTDGGEEHIGHLPNSKFMGSRNEPERIADGFFACIRAFEKAGFKTVISEGIERKGTGWAVMDRISSAASEIIKA